MNSPKNFQAHRRTGTALGGLLNHPLFPALAVLWAASLLIFAAMAVPATLFERAAGAVSLDKLIPAARPPLGFTARLLLAFVLALAGGTAAWLGALALRRRAGNAVSAARRFAGRPEPGTNSDSLSTSAPHPDDEEDFARLAAARQTPGQRRRGLTSEATEAPSILEISAIPALEPLAGPSAPAATAALAAASEAEPLPAPVSPPGTTAVRFRGLADLGAEAAARLCIAPLENLSVVQLVERFALALQARRLRGAPEPVAAPDVPAPFARPRQAGERPILSDSARPFDMPGEDHPVVTEPMAELAPWTLPEPGHEGEDTHEGLTPDPAAAPTYSSLTDLRPTTRVPPPLADFVRVDEGEEAPSAEIGPQPVVVFPGQTVPATPVSPRPPGSDAAVAPRDTEAALREALSALQRMSGAA